MLCINLSYKVPVAKAAEALEDNKARVKNTI